MKVKEVIDLLQKFNPTDDVFIELLDKDTSVHIVAIEKQEHGCEDTVYLTTMPPSRL